MFLWQKRICGYLRHRRFKGRRCLGGRGVGVGGTGVLVDVGGTGVGAGLGYVVWWKKDIRLSISLHVFSNALMRVLMMLAS